MPRNREVAIVGAGRTKFGELYERSLISLTIEAGLNALKEANLERKDIDEMIVGSFITEIANEQGNLPAFLSEELGINIPITRTEAACGSGGSALYSGINAIKSGRSDIVLVGGVEKATDWDAGIAYMAAASEWERIYNFNFTGLNAALARRYLYEYPETKLEHLALISVKNHKHARDNKNAHLRNQITVDQVLKSNIISDPFTIFHCSPVSDGAAALILVNGELAKEYENPVYITGSGMSTDSIGLYARENFTTLKANKLAAAAAFQEAGRTIKDVDIFELHDAFTIQELLAYEELGLVEKGKAWKMIEEGHKSSSRHVVYNVNGKEIIANCGGGLKADGHPVGATGVRQAVELYHQLTGKSDHPVNKSLGREPRVGLCQNIGGTGSLITVHILEVKT